MEYNAYSCVKINKPPLKVWFGNYIPQHSVAVITYPCANPRRVPLYNGRTVSSINTFQTFRSVSCPMIPFRHLIKRPYFIAVLYGHEVYVYGGDGHLILNN